MNKFTIKHFVTGFRAEQAVATGDYAHGEVLDTLTSDMVQILIQEEVDGVDLVVAIAEFNVMRDGLDFVVRRAKSFMLDYSAQAEDVKMLKRKIINATTYCGNRMRG